MNSGSFSILVLTCHVAVTFYMVGLVWFVQRVHYPLFSNVGPSDFQDYEKAHLARTNPVVGPPMLIELATALALVAFPLSSVPAMAPWLGLGLLGVIWLSTLLLQVPLHRQLARGFGVRPHRRLVSTNWIRTAAWSLRGGIVLWMLLRLASQPTS